MKRVLLLLATIILLSSSGFSRKAPIKFGEIDKTDLEMIVCAIDTSAAAVVICDYGYFNGNKYKFTRLIRIKILKKEGYKWADWVFKTRNKANIKGITYNLVDNEIVEQKLERSQIFSERVFESYYRQRLSMPNVQVGSIIDIECTFLGLPYNWYFQQSIPVLHSEIIVEPTTYVAFKKHFFGFVPLNETSKNRWVALNVPSFIDESYINSRENYISKFEFDIISISYPGYYVNYSKDWIGLSYTLYRIIGFGKPLEATNMNIRGMAKEIKNRDLTQIGDIIAAIDTLHNIKWNGIEWLFTTEPELRHQYKKHVGNSTNINLGLVVLLRKLGYETYPVALSTRSNGLLNVHSPSFEKLNYMVAYTKVNGEFILLDATDELLPYYLLPPRCLNQRGRIIDRDTSEWVSMIPAKKHKTVTSYNMILENDINLSGSVDYAFYDYAAYDTRKKLEKSADVEEYIEANTKQGMIINDVEFKNVDSIYLPVKETYDITCENILQRNDSLIYLPMMLFEKIENNPFNNKERLYPIDFNYPIERSGTINITIPANFDVVEIPAPLILSTPDKEIDYIYSISQLGDKIILNYRLRINNYQISMTEYSNLSAMYEYIIEKEAEPLVLKINH